MTVIEQDLAMVMQALRGRCIMHEDEIAASLDCDIKRFAAVTAELQRRVLAKRRKHSRQAGMFWVDAGPIIAACSWSPERVLEQIAIRPHSVGELATLAQCTLEPMSLLLRRMEYEKLVKITCIGGKGMRRWVPYTQKTITNGSSRPPVTRRRLLAQIERHQPASLEQLAEIFDRGRLYIRAVVGRARKAGKVRIVQVDGSWRYAMPDYVRPPEDIGREILLRCKDVGGDCLEWSGALNQQQHPVMRYDGNTRRVDLVLWTVVHGKALRRGHTLINTCETPGCCNHEHHKQVTRGTAMKKAYAAIGFGGEAHGRRVYESMRGRQRMLTEDEVEMIRTSSLSSRQLADLTGFSKSAINDVRARRSHKYHDYAPINRTASVMGSMVGALCR